MAKRTLDQRIAEAEERERRARESLRRLRAQASERARRERAHRLIEAGATVESVASACGVEGFEFDADVAAIMARAFFEKAKQVRRDGKAGAR